MNLKSFFIACAALLYPLALSAQTKADDILGVYYVEDDKNGDSKTEFTKNPDGTYDCTIVWIKDPIDPKTGEPWKDFRNPDKSLRSRQLLGTKIIRGISFDAKNSRWTGAKVYDPNRGIRANATIYLVEGGLNITGKVLGIGETEFWKKL